MMLGFFEYVSCAVAGVFTGLMSGLFGIGGGIVVVPALLMIFAKQMNVSESVAIPMAAGTSLAIMIFTSFSSLLFHAYRGRVQWGIYWKLFPGIATGCIIGAILAGVLPTLFMKWLLAIVLILIGIKMLMSPAKTQHANFPNPYLHHSVSFIIGLQSGLLGIGGGMLIIPYLTWCGMKTKEMNPITVLVTITVALIGTCVFLQTGVGVPGRPEGSLGFIAANLVLFVALPSMIFAPVGVWLSDVLPVAYLRYGFFLLIIGTVIDLVT